MSVISENKNRYFALGFAVGVHVLLLILCFLIVFVTPIPPFEEKEIPEMEIGLGFEGMGEMDAGGSGQKSEEVNAVQAHASSESPASTDVIPEPNVLVDNSNNDASVSVPTASTPKNVTSAAEEPEEPQLNSALSSLLATARNATGKSQSGGGGETGGHGVGTAQGIGNDGGNGHGNANNPGGNGGGYDLKGRALLKQPQRTTDTQEEGIVVVEIIVNSEGRVIKATPGKRGTTTTSSQLFAKARQAALSAKFSPSNIREQRGTYTFVFILE